MDPFDSHLFKEYQPSFQERLYKELEDPCTLELFEDPLTLVPCGHTSNESTIDKVNMQCHLCRKPFSQTVKNTTIRNLVEIAAAAPKRDEVEKKDHTEEAELLFGNVKGLVRSKNTEEAIQLLTQILDICPHYQEAIGYNACLLDIVEEKLVPTGAHFIEMKPIVERNMEKGGVNEAIDLLKKYLEKYKGIIGIESYTRSYANEVIVYLKNLNKLNTNQKTCFDRFSHIFNTYSDVTRNQMMKHLLAVVKHPSID